MFITLWISKILSRESLIKVFLILKISLILLFDTWAYDLLSALLTDSIVGLLLKNFDLAKMLLLGLGGIGREILEIFAYLPLDMLLEVFLFEIDLLNCANTYCLKDLFLFAINLFQPDSYIVKRKFYATKPNSEIWEMFLASPSKYLFIPKREMGQKLPFYSCKSTS